MTLAPVSTSLVRCGPLLAVLLLAIALAACTSAPKRPAAAAGPPRTEAVVATPGKDGPPLDRSVDPLQVPDAEPRIEPIRLGGPNKPYEVAGQTYVPAAGDVPVVERGLASWYGRLFHGRRTASGEVYNMNAMTAAHRTMPIPSYARVRNPASGREVIVRVNDRGPFVAGRVIDLSYAAAVRLGVQNGVAAVEIERITHEQIRAGLPGRTSDTALVAAPATKSAAAPLAALEVPAAMPAPMPTAVTTPVSLPMAEATVAELPAAPASAIPLPTAQPPIMMGERARALTAAAAGYWLQLGAFAKGEGAYGFQKRVAAELDWLSPLLTVFAEGGMHRLQAGPYPSREQAREAAERVRTALQLVPVVVERR
ncbi:MAG: septal ring lytic transglycosylase RlpA family protein [Vitreoscilla sp.]|nr:septal ring lytic transglycosylase RlpA family protein [Burkholderiales bacterium]MBP6336939.1 septal ring lytic transglycosylase RlpA family protein [Vitreoscilla sp.]MBP6675536.1 septal ring lytic transglycosylase RlpA family protein [Vitreoscilla sp.]